MQDNFYVGVGFLHLLSKGFGILLFDVAAVVQRYNFLVFRHHPVDKGHCNFFHALAGSYNTSLVKSDNISLFDDEIVNDGITHGVGYLTCVYVGKCRRHVFQVFRKGSVGAVIEHSGNSLRQILGGQHENVSALHQRAGLFRRKNNVFVVGQNNYVFGVDFACGRCDVFGRGVHCLTAFYYLIHQQILEDCGKSVAGTHCKQANGFAFRLVLCTQLTVLLHHVFDFYLVEFAQCQRFGKGFAGVVGVNVHLHHGKVAYANYRVAYFVEIITQFIDVGNRCAFFDVDYEKLRAVAEIQLPQRFVVHKQFAVVGEIGIGLLRFTFRNGIFVGAGYFLVQVAHDKPLEQGDKSKSAAVHNACTFKYFQHVRRLRQSFLALCQNGVHQFFNAVGALGNVDCLFRHGSHHGEDCAFLGFGNGTVSKLCALTPSFGKCSCVYRLVACNNIGKTFENLRQNNAGISSCATQCAFGKFVGKLRHACACELIYLFDCRHHCQRHVCTGISVGNGKDVQCVHLRLVYFKHFSACNKHTFHDGCRNVRFVGICRRHCVLLDLAIVEFYSLTPTT